MRYLTMAALLLAGCGVDGPTWPNATATLLESGWWEVSLNGDGVSSCIGLPYLVPKRDTAEEAIEDCKDAARR